MIHESIQMRDGCSIIFSPTGLFPSTEQGREGVALLPISKP